MADACGYLTVACLRPEHEREDRHEPRRRGLFRSFARRSPRFPTASISAARLPDCSPPGSTGATSRSWPRTIRSRVADEAAGTPKEILRAGLSDEIKYIAPLTVAGIIVLSGGPIAAILAALVGAGLGGAALKELFDDYTAPRHSEDFAAALKAGAALLWVRCGDPDRELVGNPHPRGSRRTPRARPRPLAPLRRARRLVGRRDWR